MKIGVDARLYGPKHTGIGRYVRNLVLQLISISPDDQFVIFGDPALLEELTSRPNVTVVRLKTKIYSLAEQVINPSVFSHHQLDLLHVPHFNAPLLYRGKTVLTIHDLIKHLSVGPTTTTLPRWQYKLKHLGYKLVVHHSLKKASAIVTPSHYWKNYLINQLHLDSKKIFVTYEAVDPKLYPPKSPDKSVLKKYQLHKPFLIYTGNLYPHKNVKVLINAVNSFNRHHTTKLTLAIIAGRSAFQKKISSTNHIKPLGFVPDSDFPHLYSQALALVQPSLIEGFGLTGLEAMRLNLPVLSSSATCLPEVYSQAALYFDPYNQSDLEEKISWIVKDQGLRERLISRGKERVAEFSWKQTALDTYEAYQYAKK